MQITTTAIKHKRFSTYGWNLTDNLGHYKNTLSLGEIGVLLGHKNSEGIIEEVLEKDSGLILNCIIELRIGTDPDLNGKSSQQYFFDAMPIDLGSYGVRTVATLPNFGKENCLYIRTSDNTAHFWNGEHMVQVAGGSGSDIQVDLSNYITKTDLENSYYNKTQVDEKLKTVQGNISTLTGRVSTAESNILILDNKIKGLEGTTYFVGAGADKSKPAFPGKNGGIWVSTDTGKEYIWVDSQWIELGDTTVEAQRLTSLETSVGQLETDILNKVGLDKLTEEIGKAKQETKEYVNTEQSKLSKQISADITKTKLDLQNKIAKNTAKFDSYYSKEETETLISDSLNNINIEIDEIDGNKEFPSNEDEDK